ncbi:calcium-binding protein [Sagittula salina]|uniref:Ca2+-binding protein, RTX toxin-related n=2 Tax=Alphaproteobacteria TaxID=28211 RepID=A0A940MSN2_9RHOB|nr:calcium-binding protein [Sagittula salina]MBP0484312.1 hypothetical protein [Sagittula salina]
MDGFVIQNGPNGELWWEGLPTPKQAWGDVVNMVAGPAIDFARSFGFDTTGQINAMAHTYVAAKLAYNHPGVNPFSRSGYPSTAEYMGFLKEIVPGIAKVVSGEADALAKADSIRDLYNNAVGMTIASVGASMGLTWGQVEDLLQAAAENGELISELDDPRLANALEEALNGEVNIDLNQVFLDATNGQTGIYYDENDSPQPYSYVEGALGDNVIGDGYAYDYTQDLDDDYWDWAENTVTNENGDTSPRPVSRPDDLNTDGSGFWDGLGDLLGLWPVIMDLDQDGIEISIASTAHFDVDGDGFREQTTWAAPDDGFLVIDLNADGSRGAGDGEINQGRELAFSLWGNSGDTDLQALRRAFDDNNDGILNSQDSIESELRIWQDLDQDGETDDGELRTLGEWGITQISLGYDDGSAYSNTDDDVSIFGNTLHGLASFTMNGQVVEGGVGDVSLAYNSIGWRRVETEIGYSIELESGQSYNYAVMDGTGLAAVNLTADRLDGVTGDDRNNQLDARNHTRSVQVSGGVGADAIYGGHMDDLLSGDAGADHLLGYGGNDQIFFDAHDAIVRGGSGYDTAIYIGDTGITFDLQTNEFEAAYGGSGNDTFTAAYSDRSVAIYGGDGADNITSGSADDMLSGDGGKDTIKAAGGDDMLLGGSANDKLYGQAGDDVAFGGDGNDYLHGGSGDDMLIGGVGKDNIFGSTGDDYLSGGGGQDTLRGADGDDRLHGGAGADVLEGQNGDDQLFGNDGNDTFHGGHGDDYAEGGAGDDLFHDSHGDDIYRGSEGNDTFSLTIYGGNNVVQGGTGTDKLILSGSANMWDWKHVQNGAQGVGQYLFWSSDTFVQVQDVEQVTFNGGNHQLHWTHLDRPSTAEFALSLIASHNHLIDALGTNWQTGEDWWLSHGQGEDKQITFNALQYLAANADVYNAYGIHLFNATKHYINHGRDEGRSTGNFNAEQYLRNYADVRAAYGTDLSGATIHYIQHGRAAGKTDAVIASSLPDADWDAFLTSGAGASSTITLAYVNAAEDNQDSFYWANNIAVTDPNATMFGWETRADSIDGGPGNDSITSDVYFTWYQAYAASTGRNDTVNGGDGADTIWAGIGEDLLNGQNGDDALIGEAGNDTLTGGSGNDYLRGDAGDDLLYGKEGSDVLEGGSGNDQMDGDEGSDTLKGGSGNDVLVGNWGADYLLGGDGADTLRGGDGSDALLGGSGNDQLSGDAGSDDLDGGEGNDNLDGGLGDDRLQGDAGNDTLLGGAGHDGIEGGDGHDSIEGGAGFDHLDGGSGNDTLHGGGDADILIGGAGADHLSGNDENDILNGGAGGDTLHGGSGVDAVSYADAGSAIWVRIDNTSAASFTGDAAGDTLIDIENAYGSNFNDSIYGSSGHNALWGADGNDRLYGLSGNDDLFGGAGNDSLYGSSGIDRLDGGEGNDILFGDAGADQLMGGEGIDRAQYSNATAAVLVDLQNASLNTGEAAGDTFDSIEHLHGSAYNDDLRGDAGANLLWGWNGHDKLHGRDGDDDLRGGDGNDILYGGNGADRLDGGAGIDRAMYYATGASFIADLQFSQYNTGAATGDTYISIESLHGGNGDDNLRGDAGNNTIWGGSGNDHLHGRLGNDILVGHSGADHFNFNLGWDQDQINDFTDNVDTVVFRNFGLANAQDALNHATQSGNHVVFDFGGGDTLTVLNTNLAALTDDILVY